MAKAGTRKQILLVDDEEATCIAVKMMLPQSYSLTHCKSVKDGRKAITKGAFDLVLLDLMMPNEPGYAFLDFLREKNISVPVIVLSAVDTAAAAKEALHRGAKDYITKPYGFTELRKIFEEMAA